MVHLITQIYNSLDLRRTHEQVHFQPKFFPKESLDLAAMPMFAPPQWSYRTRL